MKKVLIFVLVSFIMLSFIGCSQKNTAEGTQCLHCGEMNPEDARFCSDCGEALEQIDNTNMSAPDNHKNTETTSAHSGEEKLPTEGTVHPTENTMLPTESTVHPTENTMLPTESTVHPTENTTLSTESTVRPTESITRPTESATHPTENVTLPTENVYVMQNSGADGTYYGNSVCIDGDMVYVGYYGNLYIFSGDEVAVYAGDGTKTTTIAEMYLYNSYVYYVNMDKHCVNRMRVADGKYETVLSGAGEIKDSFICGRYLYLCTSDKASKSCFYCVDLETQEHKSLSQQEYDAVKQKPVDDGCKWNYYLAWGSNNLCRENKDTKEQELLLKSGSGNRGQGETVAKTYAIKEILYADDTRIVFKRYRMADGVEYSIWMVDSDGNNLTELLRKEYHSSTPIPYPADAPGGSGGGSGASQNGGTVGTQTCALCQGDGRVTCYYCKGTGKGKTIYVMGMPTEQGCSYCGSAGWRLCSGCGGRGVK